MHELRSYDPADFGVPTGREEEWRFTPLRRLRGLHTDAALDGKVGVAVDAAPRVAVELAQRGDQRLGIACVPADRVSARAFESFREATVLTVPAEADGRCLPGSRCTAKMRPGGGFGHMVVNVRANARAVVVLEYTGSATYADNVELIVGDGASLVARLAAGLGGRHGAPVAHHVQVGRDARITHTAVTLGGSVVRVAPSVRYAGPGRRG